ncbi:MAG: hypothetical protein R6X09_13990 [Bacteroidales bacterium]
MAIDWLSGVKDITGLISSLGNLIKNNRATGDLLLRELHINMKAFETAQKSEIIDYDKLLDLINNDMIKKARQEHYTFHAIKAGVIKEGDIRDERNKRYIGKNCAWLFKNIDEKIEDLKNQKKYHGSLNHIESTNIALQFSNLFYKIKLLAEFISE